MTAQTTTEALRARMSGFPTEALQAAARELAAAPALDGPRREIAAWIDSELQRRMIAADFAAFREELGAIADAPACAA